MKLGIDLKVDYAFKWAFGAQERIANLQSLLEHTLRDRLRGPIVDLTIIHVIELPRFEKMLADLADGFDQWLYLLRNSENIDPDFPPKELTLPAVRRTLMELKTMAHTELERLQYEAREKAVRDEVSRRNWYLKQVDEGLKKGLQQGLEQGLEQGREEGWKEAREAFQRKCLLVDKINDQKLKLGQHVSAILDLIELPEEELQGILNDLEQAAN